MTDKHSASRARALAAELRDLRRQAKLNTKDAAARIDVSPASLNRTELGQRMPPPEEVSAMMVAYGVTGVAKERVLTLARSANPTGWWEIGHNALPRQLPTLITFESEATRITHFQPLVVPGLPQTHAYMRALMHSSGFPMATRKRGSPPARAGRPC